MTVIIAAPEQKANMCFKISESGHPCCKDEFHIKTDVGGLISVRDIC